MAPRASTVAAGADTTVEEKLGEFAWNLGMAFQLIDDTLDFTSREQTLGKPVGGDLKEGKVTLPLVYALESATAAECQLVETVLRDRNYEAAPFEQILSFVEARGGVRRTRERAQQFRERALQIVSEFPETPYQRALVAVTEMVTDRDR